MVTSDFIKKWRDQYCRPFPRYIKYLVDNARHFKNVDWASISKIDTNDFSTPQELVDAIDNLKQVQHMPYVTDCIKDFSKFIPIICYKTPEEDIVAIEKEVGKITLDDSITFFTKDIVMYDPESDTKFNFGQFKVWMYSNIVIMRNYKNNKTNGDIYHPYLGQDESLCLGEYKKAYETSMKNMRFYNAFKLVEQVLTIYGGNDGINQRHGPHGVFAGWAGARCAICDEVNPLGNFVLCGLSNLKICKKCSKNEMNIDQVTKISYLPQYLEECEKCNRRQINVRRKICATCRLGEL